MADTWSVVSTAIAAEFGDLHDAAAWARVSTRLGLAALLGGVLGYERERSGKAAGVRTHMLLALGAALFVLMAAEAGIGTADMSRVIQGLIAGVGFLCAGTILQTSGLRNIKGLTTAAGLWLTSAIGAAAGLGRGGLALLCTVLGLVILIFIGHVSRFARRNHVEPAPGRARGTQAAALDD